MAQVVTDALRINKILNVVIGALRLQPLTTSVTLSLEHTLSLPTSGPWHVILLSLLPFYLVNSCLSVRAPLKGSFSQEALLSSPDSARAFIMF